MKRLSLLGITALALLSVRFLPAQTAYSLAPVEFGVELRTPDGRPALQYVTRKPADPNLQSDSVGFLYPILTPKGVPAVELAPQDHRHHRGVFLAWHSMTTPVSRADFWGWGEWAPVENRVIRSEGMQLVETDEKHALLEARNEWMAGRTKYLDETVRVRVEEQRGAYLIDLEYRLIPALEITLDQTAFGGFCVRARQGSNPTVHGPSGLVTQAAPHHLKPETTWPAQPWYAYAAVLEHGQGVNLAVMDHPSNPPTGWYVNTKVGMINPAIVAPAQIRLEAGKPFQLRYRLIVSDEVLDAERLESTSRQFRTGTPLF
jgi:hypothetical protein